MTTEINYEQKVKEVYPDAVLIWHVAEDQTCGWTIKSSPLSYGKIISEINVPKDKAWQSAYENLVASGKIQPDQPTKSDAEVKPNNDRLNIMAWEQSRLSMASGEISIKDDDAFRIGYIKGYNAKQSDAVDVIEWLVKQDLAILIHQGVIQHKSVVKEYANQLYEQFKNR